MIGWRLAVSLLLFFFLGMPLLAPFLQVLALPAGWTVWQDLYRLASLARNTLVLAAGTLALTLPAGVAGAVLLFRSDLPWRKGFRWLTLAALFVPVPLLLSAWQATLGRNGWWPLALWEDRPGQPWTSGLGPAICLNSLASLPWVILLIGQGLKRVEGELEEEALLAAGPWRVLCLVTLPRARGFIGAAALWVCWQTIGDITVTDLLEVRTFAEEIYLQFSAGGEEDLARSVALSLPLVGLTWVGLALLVPLLDRSLPPLATLAKSPLFRLGWARWFWFAGVLAVALFLAVAPLASLVRKAGLQGWPETWSARAAWEQCARSFALQGGQVFRSLLVAGMTGILLAGLALVSCWAAQGNRFMRFGLLSLVALGLAMPGPVVGIGLKETILELVNRVSFEPLTAALFRGPSALPILWAQGLRFFPIAAALLWPAARMVPRELREAAWLDGAGPGRELVFVIWPLTRLVFAWSALAVTALSLGEFTTSKMAETPGSERFAHLLLASMHYGADREVAGLCLLLLAELFAVGVVAGLIYAACFTAKNKEKNEKL